MAAQPMYVKHRFANTLVVSKVVTIHYYEFLKDFAFDGESHDFWELVYADKETVLVTAGEREFALRQGEAAFHKPNEFHKLRADGVHAPNVLIVSFETRSAAMRFFENKALAVPPGLRPMLAAIIGEGRAAFELPFFDPGLRALTVKKGAPVGAQQLIRINLEQLLILLLRQYAGQGDKTQVFTSKSKLEKHIAGQVSHYLEQHLCESVRVEQVCRHFHYGKTRLSAIFKSAYGHGVRAHHNMLRMERASRLLRERNLTCAEISEQLGFSSPQYFSQCFRQATGMSPGEYCRSLQAQG